MQFTSQSPDFSTTPDRTLRVSAGVLSTVGPTGATAVLDPDSGRFYSLNEVGTRVWSLLTTGTTFRAIIEELRNEYDVPPKTLGTDMERLLRQFAMARLLEIDGDDHGHI